MLSTIKLGVGIIAVIITFIMFAMYLYHFIEASVPVIIFLILVSVPLISLAYLVGLITKLMMFIKGGV